MTKQELLATIRDRYRECSKKDSYYSAVCLEPDSR